MARHLPGQEARIQNAEKECKAIMETVSRPIGQSREYFPCSIYGSARGIKRSFDDKLGKRGKMMNLHGVMNLPCDESYIYLFPCIYSGSECFKIGRTTNPRSRFGTYNSSIDTHISNEIIVWDISIHI